MTASARAYEAVSNAQHLNEWDQQQAADEFWRDVIRPTMVERILVGDDWGMAVGMSDVVRRSLNDIESHGHSLEYVIQLIRENASELCDEFRGPLEKQYLDDARREAEEAKADIVDHIGFGG